MENELKLYKNQVDEYRRDIKLINNDHNLLIKKWINEQDQQHRELEQSLDNYSSLNNNEKQQIDEGYHPNQ